MQVAWNSATASPARCISADLDFLSLNFLDIISLGSPCPKVCACVCLQASVRSLQRAFAVLCSRVEVNVFACGRVQVWVRLGRASSLSRSAISMLLYTCIYLRGVAFRRFPAFLRRRNRDIETTTVELLRTAKQRMRRRSVLLSCTDAQLARTFTAGCRSRFAQLEPTAIAAVLEGRSSSWRSPFSRF